MKKTRKHILKKIKEKSSTAQKTAQNLKEEHYVHQAIIFRALGNTMRVKLIYLLLKNAMTVTELWSEIGGDLSTVSKHLTLLERVGLVISNKHGRQVSYTLDVDNMSHLLAIARTMASNFASKNSLTTSSRKRS